MTEFTPIPAIDGFVEALGTSITHREAEWATYDPITDQVQVPPRGSRATELHYVLVCMSMDAIAAMAGPSTPIAARQAGRTGSDFVPQDVYNNQGVAEQFRCC